MVLQTSIEVDFMPIYKIETQESKFAQKLLDSMISREKFILNNKVFIFAIFLDSRYKITLSVEQYLVVIEHFIKYWIQLNKFQSEHIDSNNQTSLGEHYDRPDTNIIDK